MKTFVCVCKNTLFYENSQCLACEREVGWCPQCRNLVALLPPEDESNTHELKKHNPQEVAKKQDGKKRGQQEGDRKEIDTNPENPHDPASDAQVAYRCGNPACGAQLGKCYNYAVENVCNRCVIAPAGGQAPEPLCDCCRYNETIPDLSIPGNREKWYRLEIAKRRLFYGLDQLGLPYGRASDGFSPPLAFDFKADVVPEHRYWRDMGHEERVFTGHADGKITINIREADDAERERLRIDFQEAQRTLIGHFRHEIGHYYWHVLVEGKLDEHFQQVFGDHENPLYADALQRYYDHGPPADWRARFVSAYASMHPWEDFAETFATYLDMIGVLDTAMNMKFGALDCRTADFEAMLAHYERLGMVANELNRSMGLTDLVPEIFIPPVRLKLRFVHDLIRRQPSE